MPEGGGVQLEEIPRLVAGQGSEVGDLAPQMLGEVMQHRARRADGRAFVPQAEAVEGGHFEVLPEGELRGFRSEDPILVTVQDGKAVPEQFLQGGGAGGGDDFGRMQPLQLGPQGRFPGHFSAAERPRGQIHQGQAETPSRAVNGGEEIVALRLEHPLVEMRSRAQDLRHLALHQLAGARFLHLLAKRHFAPGLEQAGDVTAQGVKGDAAHGHDPAFGERHVEQLRPRLGVLKEHLVKVPEAEQQQGVLGQFALDPPVLRHHGRQLLVVAHRLPLP